LSRDTSQDQTLVFDGAATCIVGSGDLETDAEAGFYVALTRDFDDHGINLRYFEVIDASGANSAFAPTAAFLYPSMGGNLGGNDTYTLTSRFMSSLLSAEANLVHFHRLWLDFLLGFRWFGVDENLGIIFDGIATDGQYTGGVTNDLYGIRAGADILLWDKGGPLSVECMLKGGIFYNDISQHSQYVNGTTYGSLDDDHTTSLVGELLLTGTLLITPNVAISGGFTLVCLTDLALALDQPGAIGWAAGPGYGQGIGDNGDVCYYGSVIGLIVTN